MTVQWAQGFSGHDHKLDLLKLIVVIILLYLVTIMRESTEDVALFRKITVVFLVTNVSVR